MNVLSMIKKAKDEFKQRQIMKDTEMLRQEKIRQGQLAKINAENVKARRDVENIQKFNQQAETKRPNLIKNFGTNLAAAMDKAKVAQKQVKGYAAKNKKVYSGGNNQGSQGIDFGGHNGSPFNK